MESSIIAIPYENCNMGSTRILSEKGNFMSQFCTRNTTVKVIKNLGNATIYFMSITRDSNSTEKLRSAGHSFYLLSFQRSMLRVFKS